MEPIKDAFRRLSRFGHAAKERALPVWKSAQLQSEPALQWLKQFGRGRRWLAWSRVVIVGGIAPCPDPRFVIGAGGAHGTARCFTPFFAPIGALLVGLAAFGQRRTAGCATTRRPTPTASDASRKASPRPWSSLGATSSRCGLGGIYSLERISKESPDDYWTVMENLTAFVRERSRRNEAERTSQDLEQRVSRRAYFLWQEAGRPDGRAEDFWADAAKQEEFGEPATDIAAVLTVIKRRSEQSREREGANDWRFDLSGAILKR